MGTEHDNRIAWIDGLRAIAMLLVIARHVFDRPFASLYGGHLPAVHGFAWVIFAAASIGWAGVGLFFVISGYLVAGGAFLSVQAGRFSVKTFILKRLVRVYLPAAIFLILFRRWSIGSPRGLIVPETIDNLLFITNYTGSGWLGHYWSLCVEIHFYLAVAILAPIAARVIPSPHRLGHKLAIAASVFLVMKVGISAFDLPTQNFYTFSHWQFDFFAAGAALRMMDGLTLPRSAGYAFFALSLAALLFAALVANGNPGGDLANQSNPLRLTISLAFILLASIAIFLASEAGVNFLASHFMRRLGAISFSVYIVHLPLIEWMRPVLIAMLRPFDAWPIAAYLIGYILMVALSIAAGALFFVAVERPAFRLHNRIGRRRAPDQAIVTTALGATQEPPDSAVSKA